MPAKKQPARAGVVSVSAEYLPITQAQLAEAMSGAITAAGVWERLRGKRRAHVVSFIIDAKGGHRWHEVAGAEVVAQGESHPTAAKARRAAIAFATAPTVIVQKLPPKGKAS